MLIHGVEIKGTNVERQTRCAHYKTDFDVIALKFKCYDDWFPCFECHAENTNHAAEVWSKNEFNEKAVLCGVCGLMLEITEYLNCRSTCPKCESSFNPRCANHYHLYFQI